MTAVLTKDQAPWLTEADLRKLLAILAEGDEEARVAGGAVRNALLGLDVADIDVATTVLPAETVRRAEAAGFKAVPTGFEHGTVTVVMPSRAVEVTTLRADIETDGRHAVVSFGRDWQADAERRDFTVNALYADEEGTVLDLVGGVEDIGSRTIRFIGDAESRIREDYLRILRFFRFFAWYGSGRPDADGLRACARLKEGLDGLSAERVWSELKKTLSAPDPSRALLWMRQTGVLSRALPESEKWGIDAIHGLVAAERSQDWRADPMLRLESIVPPDAGRMEALARRLKMSRAEAERIRLWAMTDAPKPDTTDAAFAAALYRGDRSALRDRLRLRFASAAVRANEGVNGALEEAGGINRLLRVEAAWQRPAFPVSGEDLLSIGMHPGSEMGKALRRLEDEWITSGFRLDRAALLAAASHAAQD